MHNSAAGWISDPEPRVNGAYLARHWLHLQGRPLLLSLRGLFPSCSPRSVSSARRAVPIMPSRPRRTIVPGSAPTLTLSSADNPRTYRRDKAIARRPAV
ncbi:hypothetical protein AAFF_G00055360 [Aldrovandia affinis]|uniref:Uncharacterized protein n=1 Tax=Aldrovandia affinis TaxID=143900 RepID=A0AAD7VXK5_9TELE|nr:hypothetical protein AAFF_G00055360 [Aldrovandia affinis]